MLDKFGLKATTIQKINKVFSQFPEIDKTIIYGSRAKGTFKNGSDIDLTLSGNLDHKSLNKVELALDELNLPYLIDLSLINHILDQALIAHIKRAGKVFYRK